MNKLLFEKGVWEGELRLRHVRNEKEREARLARKRTSIISNLQTLLKELAKYEASERH